jgi:hypothetical protein
MRINWVDVEHIVEMRNAFNILVGRHSLGDRNVDGKVRLKFILKKFGVRMCIGLNWLGSSDGRLSAG